MSQATREQDGIGAIGAIGRDIADDAVKLVRAELALARAQLRDAALRMAFGVALIVVAAALLSVFAIEALSAVPAHYSQPIFGNDWLGWVAFGGIFLVLALVFVFAGILLLRGAVKDGKATQQQFKEDADWLKGLTKRGNSES